MDELIKRLALECACKLITMEEETPNGNWWVCIVSKPIQASNYLYHSKGHAEYDLNLCRKNALPFLIEMIHKFCLVPPFPSPVSDQRLQEIWDEAAVIDNEDATKRYNSLKTHIIHLTNLLRFTANESEGQAYAAGYDAGMKAASNKQPDVSWGTIDL